MSRHVVKSCLLAAVGVLALVGGRSAMADAVYDTAGSFSVSGTNAPDTFTTNGVSFGSTTVDGGALTLTTSIVSGPGSSEWAVFNFQTSSGGSIAGNQSLDWALDVNGIPLTQPGVITHFFLDWGTNGTLANPTSQAGGNLPLETNPITGSGTVFGENFNIPVTTTIDLSSGADPFNGFLSSTGIDPTGVNEIEIGVLVAPSAVPEPASLALLGVGVAGLGAMRRRRNRA